MKVTKALKPGNEWFFLTEFIWTDYPSKDDPSKRVVARFPNKEYLRKTLETFDQYQKVLVWKSRQLTMTWFCVAHFLYKAATNPNVEIIFQCDTEAKVKETHFRKFDVMYARLDPFLKLVFGEMKKLDMSREFTAHKALIIGTPSGADVIASRNPNHIFSDEMSLQKFQAQTIASSLPSVNEGGQFIGVATTKPDTFFMDLVNDLTKRGEEELQKSVDVITLQRYMTLKHNNNGWTVLDIGFRTDPTKCTKEWIENARKGFTPEMWNQEMEKDENAFSGIRIYRDIPPDMFRSDLKWQPGRPIVRGWDFGYQLGACVIGYFNTRDQFIVLLEVLQFEGTTMDLGKKVLLETQQMIRKILLEYPEDRQKDMRSKVVFEDYCDIAGKHRTSNATKTDIEWLNVLGVYPSYRDSDIERGLDKVRHRYRKRKDGNYGLLVNSNRCPYLVRGFKGKYAYALNKKPRDTFESDPHDAFRYIIDNVDWCVDDAQEEHEEETYYNMKFNDSGLPIE